VVRRAAADAVAIVVFATIGQLSHHGHVSVGGYAADALPLLAGWFAAAAVFRGRFVQSWLTGVTAGVAIRMVVLGHYRLDELAFWLVALAFLGLFAATARGLVLLAGARGSER